MDLSILPNYYRNYVWEDKHALFGYPPDRYPEFEWIRNLERRFLHFREHPTPAPLFLITEMIQWGGSQNGVLEKFQNAIGSNCLHNSLNLVLKKLQDPEGAIGSALNIPGLGLTYASKLLRFLSPETYGALDGRIRKGLARLTPPPLPKIYDGNTASMIKGYTAFTTYIRLLRQDLTSKGIALPRHPGDKLDQNPWRAADIEMALFGWASGQQIDDAV
jgi:hypothetical protein